MPIPDPLVDTFGRLHNNLRISVTDRCNIRCFYCMPEDHPIFVERREILSFEEIERFARIAVKLGINKIRLTGGEPLVRRDLHLLVRKLVNIAGISDISLTTNGVLLPELAGSLHEAGLRRINVHLDTLDPDKFTQISRRPGLEKVIDGIKICKQLGYEPIKLNTVAVRGMTEDDIVPMVRFARQHGLQVRFIEYMPLDADGNWQRDKVLFAADIIDRISNEFGQLTPLPDHDPRAPASEFEFVDGSGKIGIIASVSKPFCQSCNRLRLTADGKIRNCLFAHEELDIKALLRGGGSEKDIIDLIRRSIHAKQEGHEINAARFIKPQRPMYAIGG